MRKITRTTMYHVAPQDARAAIQTEGLKPDGEGVTRLYLNSPSGVYLWGNIGDAENWASDVAEFGMSEEGAYEDEAGSQDVWGVDVSDLPIKQDAVWFNEDHDSDKKRAAWVYPGPISPDRLRLETTFEAAGDWRQANILDPIEQKLDQTIYQGTTPRKSVQDFIKRIYYRALDKELAVNGEQWADLYLTGSLTTYQYSVTSDCDVSVFPNYDLLWKQLGLSPDEARKKLIHLSIEHIDGTFLPGTTHPLQFFVVPHGTLPGDLYQPGLRSAFDLHDSQWFQKPEKDRVHDIAIEYPDLFKRAEDIGDKLTQMLDAGDDEAARELWHQIHKKRQLDQRAGLGDFCEGNIVYKYLLNEGLFDRIRSELGEFIANGRSTSQVMAKVSNRDLMHQKWRLTTGGFDDPEDQRRYMLAILNMTPGRDVHSPQFHDKAVQLLGLADITPEEAETAVQSFIAAMDAESVRAKENWELVQQEMIRGREQHDQEFAIINAKYGERALEIFNRFERQRPDDAPEFAGNRDEVVDYMVTQGWQWKFILELGIGSLIWADSETHDYNGVYGHTYAMQDLKNMSDVPLVKAEMAGGWIDKEPLQDGDGPYEVRVLSGEGLTDEQILTTLGFQPGEAIVTRIGRPLRMQENTKWTLEKSADLWEDRVTQKIIYDFDKDTIMLGTQATQAEHPDSKIIGEYDDGTVTLFGVEKQWISPQYFHRLWAFSYPDKELKDVYYKREEGNVKLRTVRRPKRSFDDITQRMFDAAPVREEPSRSGWTPQIPQSVMEMAIYKHRCPQCGGYLTDRGGIYTCQSCPFEWDANAQDFGGK